MLQLCREFIIDAHVQDVRFSHIFTQNQTLRKVRPHVKYVQQQLFQKT